MKLKRILRTAFTLIELLVVMSIIAMLAGLAVPAYKNAIKQARMLEATHNVQQIGLALQGYARDAGGVFPGTQGENGKQARSSNEAFRYLIPDYMDSERVFALALSKVGPKADGNISSASKILQRGENHWAYIAGLSTTSNSGWPLVVDSTDGSGLYTTDESVPGGTWGGTNAVVLYCDGSGRSEKLSSTADKGKKRHLPRVEDRDRNALQVTDYMGDGVRLLEPER